MPKKELLFVSPVIPKASGGGPQMRAYYALKELAQQYRVSMLVVLWDFDIDEPVCRSSSGYCHREIIVSAKKIYPGMYRAKKAIDRVAPFLSRLLFFPHLDWLSGKTKLIKKAAEQISGYSFDAIHLFRLRMYPIAESYLKKGSACRVALDLDDVESRTRARIASLYLKNINLQSLKFFLSSVFYKVKEQNLLSTFDTVYVCSSVDKAYLKKKYNLSNVEVAVNVIPFPPEPILCPDKKATKQFTFLFAGSFTYFPNSDSVSFFCSEILPLIIESTTENININIVGSGLSGKYEKELSKNRNVHYLGFVDDIVHEYQKADAVIVPIRAGGGTRIKIIEALSYGKPVISTYEGAEGLGLTDGEEILLASTSRQFAEKSLRLIHDRDFAERIGKKGYLTAKKKFCSELNDRFNPDNKT